MNVLGVSFDYHDAAATFVCDGVIVAAAQEERFTRKKHDPSLPVRSMSFCLEKAGITAHDLDLVVYYENSFDKFARILWATRGSDEHTKVYRERAIRLWMSNGKLEVRQRIAKHLSIPEVRIINTNHHLSHAASAFYCSPFERAIVITLDGAGEFETASVSIGENLSIKRLQSIRLPHSLGLLYSALTAYLGFEVNEGEYKVMGMAGFGMPSFFDELRSLVSLEPDGSFKIDQECFNFLAPTNAAYNEHLVEFLGPPRRPKSAFSLEPGATTFAQDKRFADIAASIQKLTEEIILHVASCAVARTGIRDVCLAGGCALNSLANPRLVRELGIRLFVQPAAGDAGGALGAALFGSHAYLQCPRGPALTHAYFGRSFEASAIRREIEACGLAVDREFADDGETAAVTAQLLTEGSVVGWFQGCAEWGPRALGARSILADPTRRDMKAVVNSKIKFREPFRPFAPAVLSERATRYFDVPAPQTPSGPENFMLEVCRVRPEMSDQVPATTHVDGTARIQTVRSEVNPLFYRLIENMEQRNGVPVVLNTSFNLRGEPIVDSPADAIRTFSWSDMDYMVLGHFLVKKEWTI